MKTLLITAFEPFAKFAENESDLALQALPDTVGNYRLHRMTLPVEYGRAATILTEALERLTPDAVLCLGLAASRKAVTPEFVAVNARDSGTADNTGRIFQGEPCIPGGPAALGTRLPVRAMVEALRQGGIPAAVSYTAGAFVCNDVFYHLLWALEGQGRDIPAGFLHLPARSPAGATPAITLDMLCEALRRCILSLDADRPAL